MAPTLDDLLQSLAAGASTEPVESALRALCGEPREAVVRLLCERLADPSARADPILARRLFFCLQYCWAPLALDAVKPLLGDADPEWRRMAAIVIDAGEGRACLAHCHVPWLDAPDPALAAQAVHWVESFAPDPARAARLLRDERRAHWLSESLGRYYTPRLSGATRALLARHDEPWLARAALVALIQQNDRSAMTLQALLGALQHELAEARELAAEYLAWHGHARVLGALQAALDVESDAHARASIAAALKDLRHRQALGRLESGPASDDPDDTTPADADFMAQPITGSGAYAAAAGLLACDAPPSTLQHAWQCYRHAEAFEPCWHQDLEQDVAPALLASRLARYRLQTLLFAWPQAQDDRGATPTAVSPPPSTALMPPIRAHLGTPATSYGVRAEPGNRAYADLIHVGDDVGWGREHLTVVAMADGVVRTAKWVASWGHLVVIEHCLKGPAAAALGTPGSFAATLAVPVRNADGSVTACTLLAHLGPWLRVVAGQSVCAGEKIGVIGRAYTVENGGYPAHLHVGLHWGPYAQHPLPGTPIALRHAGLQQQGLVTASNASQLTVDIKVDGEVCTVYLAPTWVRGYLPGWAFAADEYGWINPRAVLARYADLTR